MHVQKRGYVLKLPYIVFHAAVCILLLQRPCSAQQDRFLGETEIQRYGSTYIRWFYASELDSLVHMIADTNYTLEALRSFRNTVGKQAGSRVGILNAQYGIEPGQYYYIQYARFSAMDRPVRTLFTFDGNGTILQFTVQPLPAEAPSKFGDYRMKTACILPFRGRWFVAWGGRTINENQHAVSSAQRYAYDFLIRKDGKTFTGTGRENSDYYCWEKEVIAPAAGTIVDVVDDVPDNRIGDMPPVHGNRVVIDHGNSEYSVLAHFKQGSILVKNGDAVRQGQVLGLCGNSGHSSEPHIHFHVQNTPDMEQGEGLPVIFYSYLSNTDSVRKGEPVIGEFVENHTAIQ